jgi:ppGpp synthetase/RelA/SpoT-type nucleotidyltranferase
MGDVRRAGEALRGQILWCDDSAEEIKEIFRIANNWRDSHMYPMQRIRHEVIGQIRRLKQNGKTFARVKRMASIRRKLRNLPQGLNQIQDLGGCRAILPAMKEAQALINSCRENLAHGVHNVDDYIKEPKPDGYRSYHIVYKFLGSDTEEIFKGRRIELQVRTQLQHSWATAVEAVGTFRGENLKAGQGDEQWLRLFELMASEIALAENCPELDGAPARIARIREIRDLNKSLSAIATLENLRQAFNYVESRRTLIDPEYFLIRYDNRSSTVTVDPYDSAIAGSMSFDEIERDVDINVVLVAADKVEELIEGYPNYYGDVQLFKRSLRDITYGKVAQEFSLVLPEAVKPKPKEVPDLSWFFRRGKRWR